jgi:hypothetical protein
MVTDMEKAMPHYLVPNPEMLVAREALRVARLQRAAALLAVASGDKSVFDVIAEACSESGRPLLKLELRDLVLSQPDLHTSGRADGFLRRVASLLESEVDLSRERLSWLVDPRAGGRRLIAWIDADSERRPPWPGFPHTAEDPVSEPGSDSP